MAGKNMGRSTFRRKGVTGQVKTHHPKGTVCGAKGCTTFISIYNPDPICSPCEEDHREAGVMERRMNKIQQALVAKGKAA